MVFKKQQNILVIFLQAKEMDLVACIGLIVQIMKVFGKMICDIKVE